MFSIGMLSRETGVKIPTIRYYEAQGLLPAPERTEGNQRRYGRVAAERLGFIRHARDLGLSLDAIRELLALSDEADAPCAAAHRVARAHLADVQGRIARLQKLEAELARIAAARDSGVVEECRVLAALTDHGQCHGAH